MDAAVMGAPQFRNFYADWAEKELEMLRGMQGFLKEVAESGEPPPQETFKELVDKLIAHVQVYHDAKIRAATDDTAHVSSGLWRTPLEAGFIWLGGWRPSAAIMLAYSLMGMQIEHELQSLLEGLEVPAMAALSHQQLTDLNDLQQSTRKAEGELSDRLAVLQMMMADEEMTKATVKDPPLSESKDYEDLGTAMDGKLSTLRDLLVDADTLRLQTIKGMIDILTPMQAAQYLVAAVELSKAVRELGIQRMKRNGYTLGPHKTKEAKDLHTGAAQGETGLLSQLLESGADPTEGDYEGRTPLHVAALKGHNDCVKLLLERGADVNAPVPGADSTGMTPLVDALKAGHDRTVKLLVDHGARMPVKESGVEICKAAATGNLEYLRRLVETAKCDPNTVNYDQRTPLHLAAAEGTYPAVDLLLRAGGNPLVTDRHGYTPLDEARRGKHQLVVELLEKHLAGEGSKGSKQQREKEEKEIQEEKVAKRQRIEPAKGGDGGETS